MALTNVYGTQPTVQAQRGRPRRNRRPNTRGPGGAGQQGVQPNPLVGTMPVTGGGGGRGQGKGVPDIPSYGGGRQGEALANQDVAKFIQDMLYASGQGGDTGTPYSAWKTKTQAENLQKSYDAYNAMHQGASPQDWLKATYGAGWETTQGERRQHGPGRRPGDTTFNPGSLGTDAGGDTSPGAYQDYLSNTDPGWLRSQVAGGGNFAPNGNAQFSQWFDQVFSPGVQSAYEAARNNAPATPATGGPIVPAPQDDTAKGKGKKKNKGFDPAPYSNPAPGNATTGQDLSLNDFIAGRDLLAEAQRAYAMRPDAQRTPGPLSGSGRWSWWG